MSQLLVVLKLDQRPFRRFDNHTDVVAVEGFELA